MEKHFLFAQHTDLPYATTRTFLGLKLFFSYAFRLIFFFNFLMSSLSYALTFFLCFLWILNQELMEVW